MSEELEGGPQYYADFTGIQVGPYGALLDFRLRPPGDATQPSESQAIVRMSVAHLWVVAKIASRVIKDYVNAAGPIPMPPETLKELNLEEEYREEMGERNV